MKFFDFVLDRGSRVELRAIAAPVADFSSASAVFEAALRHERKVTASIHALYARAMEERDYECLPILHWFINEQVEEEATVARIIEQLSMAADNGAALLLLDRELAARAVASGE